MAGWRNSDSGLGRRGGARAAFAGGGGAGRLRAHVVADAGHDVAEVAQVVAGEWVEQQAADDLDVTGQDALEECPAVVGDGDQGGALVFAEGARAMRPAFSSSPAW